MGRVSIESRRLVHMVGWRLFNRIDGDSPPTTLRAEMDLRDVDTDVVQTVSDVSCERRVPSRASRRANAPANQGLTRCVKILIARDAKKIGSRAELSARTWRGRR